MCKCTCAQHICPLGVIIKPECNITVCVLKHYVRLLESRSALCVLE